MSFFSFHESTLKPFNRNAIQKTSKSVKSVAKHSRKSFNYCKGAKYLNGVTKHVNRSAINESFIYSGDFMLIQLKRFWKQLPSEANMCSKQQIVRCLIEKQLREILTSYFIIWWDKTNLTKTMIDNDRLVYIKPRFNAFSHWFFTRLAIIISSMKIFSIIRGNWRRYFCETSQVWNISTCCFEWAHAPVKLFVIKIYFL